MNLLSFQEAVRGVAVSIDDARQIAALEMLWHAHRYALLANSDFWEFAVEIDELRRARISNSDLRWLLSQDHVAHAVEITASGNKRKFRRIASNSITERSCFIIAESGVALLESIHAARASTTRNALVLPAFAKSRRCRIGENQYAIFESDAKPHWDSTRRQLLMDGNVVKCFRSPAPNQQLVLDAFQASEWAQLIYDPLPMRPAHCPKRRLHDAIKFLNRHHLCHSIRFGGDGSGRGVFWERVSHGK